MHRWLCRLARNLPEPDQLKPDQLKLGEVLRHIPGWQANDEASPVQLLSGVHNQAFRVQTTAGAFVVRRQPHNAAMLGANRRREVTLNALAARHGIAPQVVKADANGAWIITEFVPGAVWSPADFANPLALGRLADVLRKLHAVPVPQVESFDLLALIDQHCAALARSNPAEQHALAALVSASAGQFEAIGGADRPQTIVHNDLHHSNIIDSERLVLIDWEYAGVADPIFDLACVLAYYPQAQPWAALMLDRSGLAASTTVQQLRSAAALFRTLSDLWVRVGLLKTES